MNIRKANTGDLSRIAEIYVFNNRINYLPIFKDESFSFGDLQVISLVDNYFSKSEIIDNLFVYDDGLIRGFMQMSETEICKLYVDTFFQSRGVGRELIEKHGFYPTDNKKFEEDTTEYLVELKRQ